jgi:hypothetical protein
VTVTPTTNLVDGQVVTVTIRSTPDVVVNRADARLCRAGVNYQESSSDFPPIDAAVGGANCPIAPISTSADVFVSDSSTSVYASSPDGESFLFKVGAGVVEWLDQSSAPPFPTRSLTCDGAHACVLLVELQYQPSPGAPARWKPYPIPIGYGNADPIAGCGGPASGALTTAGSDRMFDAWIGWTLGFCGQPGAHGAPTRASFIGEGNAVQQVSTGAADLAYTSGGYDPAMGFAPAINDTLPDGGRRAVVAIPVAINAAVLSVGGGVFVNGTHKVPYRDISMALPWTAAMMSGGDSGVPPYVDAINTQNPEILNSGLFDPTENLPHVSASGDAEASSWYLTRYLHDLAPNDWKVPDSAVFGANSGRARGIDAALALADPSYQGALQFLSGRPAMQKVVFGAGSSSSGGVWLFTDRQTSAALNITNVKLQNKRGDFVAPTSESLLAAIPAMVPNAQGLLISDPSAVGPVGGVQPYPMTMVEYALAPTEPLLNDDCTVRSAGQQLLHDWLTYITGDAGQASLPGGMVPLTSELKAQAAQRIAQVGAAPVTGTCAAITPPPTPPSTSPDATPSGGLDAAPAGSSTSARGSATRPVPTATPTPTSAPGGATSAPSTALASVPAFGGRSAADPAGILLALLGIIGLTSVAAFTTSKVR